MRQENDRRLTEEKYELSLPIAFIFFLMTKKDLMFRIRYRQLLFYRARAFISHIKSPHKGSEELQTLQKQQAPMDTLQKNNMITDPEEDQEEERESNPDGGCLQWGASRKGPPT